MLSITQCVYFKHHLIAGIKNHWMECVVCMDAIQQGELHELPCGHKFHTACILSWARSDIEGHGQCPVCRSTEGAGAEQRVDVSQLSYTTYRSDAQSHALMEILARAAKDFAPAEEKLYRLLLREAERRERAQVKYLQRLRDFKTKNRKLVAEYTKLNNAKWRYLQQKTDARKNLFSLFNVLTVTVSRRARSGRASSPVVRRRSERLAQR